MFITTQNEIISLMPTARWDRPSQLFGYLEEEERVALEPILGTDLYEYLCDEYKRLREKYGDITATTVKPTKEARKDPRLPYADVTERLERIHSGKLWPDDSSSSSDEDEKVPDKDMASIRLLRICQQIEFYKMLSHKAGLLTVSFNEGGGMNMISADGYDPADEKRMERVVKDAFMSAGRAIDSLLLFLEADAKGKRQFTELWSKADAFYLHRDLLFQTARVLNEYLDIKGERMAYVSLVRDIRFCQNTYLKPRIGAKLLKEVIDYANKGFETPSQNTGQDDSSSESSDSSSHEQEGTAPRDDDTYGELLSMLRTALAFFVEGRRTTLEPVRDKLSRRDSMTDAQQAMAMACEFIAENLETLGEAAKGTPIYIKAMEEKTRAEQQAAAIEAARKCRHKAENEQNSRKIYTGFPATHRTPER